MKTFAAVLFACSCLVCACASPALRQDCQARKAKVDHVAAIAPTALNPGLTKDQVRALLGEPDEIVTAKGVGDFDIWKYYLYEDCQAHLGLSAPTTDVFFVGNRLANWNTHEPVFRHYGTAPTGK
jgi:outer membrane protein assembly factor BamE (lipoprotein component of BamABCDE complex)